MIDVAQETKDMYYGADSAGDDNNEKARELVDQGWRATYAAIFGASFVDVLAKHHIESIEWHWNSRIAILEFKQEQRVLRERRASGEITDQQFNAIEKDLRKMLPEYYADFPKFSRGHMKSTIARRVAVMDAFISYAYREGGYCLYFSGTDDKTSKHAVSINQLLQSAPIRKYAPALSQVKKSEEGGRALGWKATFFYTSAGYIYHFGSLQSGLAGGNVDDLRPTLLIPDDIDDRKDSVAIAERNTKAFTLEILPMGASGALTFFAQNLISRFSVMYRIHKNKLKVLTNRRPSEPVPAVLNLEITYHTVGGISKPYITGGTATWEKGMPIEACQEELQRNGEASFRSECQHEVEQSKTGLVHKKYEDAVHAISYSQFGAVFGSPDAWKYWHKVPANDWARTKTKFHSNVAGYLAVSSQNTKYPGMAFMIPYSFAEETTPEDVAVRMLEDLDPIADGSQTWKNLVDDAWKRTNAERHFTTVKERLEFTKSTYKTMIRKYAAPHLERFRVGMGVNSHSENIIRQLFNEGFGFNFIPANPTQTEALEEIDEAMRIDFNLPHLFNPSINGWTRFYVLCPDDLTQTPIEINGVDIYPPLPYPDSLEGDELFDSDLFRFQMCERRFNDPELTKTGETTEVMFKVLDDFGQMLQMIYSKKHLLDNVALTQEEKREEHLKPTIRTATLDQMENSAEKDSLLQRRRLEVEKYEREHNKPVRHAGMTRFSRR